MHKKEKFNNSVKPYLSDVIDYATDIEPHKILKLYSGVGSGKNTLINKFINGDPEKGIPKKTVLIITSRRAKVNELLADENLGLSQKVGKWGNVTLDILDSDDVEYFQKNRRIITDKFGFKHEVYQKSVACTNAFIERHIQYVYDPKSPGTHLWELFDMIVVDEVHSLVLDASYQNAPSQVMSLINEILRRHMLAEINDKSEIEDYDPSIQYPYCKNIILMTGTPTTVKKLPILYATPFTLNKMNECISVVPKHIWFMDGEKAKESIEQKIAKGERCIYMTNHVLFPDSFCSGTTIPPESVAVSFSDVERRNAMAACTKKPENQRTEEERSMATVYNNMVEVENQIAKTGLIPEKYSVWISTSRNKEGISINSKDINHVYIESHCCNDIIQMAGRVRHGTENLYIIIDSRGFPGDMYHLEYKEAMELKAPNMLEVPEDADMSQWSTNAFLKTICEEYSIPDFYCNRNSKFRPYRNKNREVRKYINYIHSKENYVRFDFFRNHFCYYNLREVSMNYHERQMKLFAAAAKDHSIYQQIFQKLFPTAIVHPYKDRVEQMLEYLNDLLRDDPHRKFTEEEISNHMIAFNKIRFVHPEDYLKSRNSIIRPLNYTVDRVSNDKSKPSYNYFRYKPIKIERKAS